MGAIYDRSHEHLGTSDTAIIFMRRQLIRWSSDLQHGIEPPMLNDASLFRARPIDIITDEPGSAAHLGREPQKAPLGGNCADADGASRLGGDTVRVRHQVEEESNHPPEILSCRAASRGR